MDNKDVIAVLEKAIEYLRSHEGSMLQEASPEGEERARAEAVLRIEGLVSLLQSDVEGMTPAELMPKILTGLPDERSERMDTVLEEIRHSMNAKKRRRKGRTGAEFMREVVAGMSEDEDERKEMQEKHRRG